MKQADTLHLAFVLHTRAYRDSSLLVELFTQDFGRLTAVARGARQQKSSLRCAIQAFNPLLISWTGKNELVTMRHAEIVETLPMLKGARCWCGMYLNELLTYLLHRYDPHPDLFELYLKALAALRSDEDIEITLRRFEKALLSELGYGLQLNIDEQGFPIQANDLYQFINQRGIVRLEHSHTTAAHNQRNVFQGKSLLALHHEDFSHEQYLKDAKRLLRQSLQPLLGNKVLKSRKMFS